MAFKREQMAFFLSRKRFQLPSPDGTAGHGVHGLRSAVDVGRVPWDNAPRADRGLPNAERYPPKLPYVNVHSYLM